MSGALSREQEKAIFANLEKRPDYARMALMQSQTRANEGSVPTTHRQSFLRKKLMKSKKMAWQIRL